MLEKLDKKTPTKSALLNEARLAIAKAEKQSKDAYRDAAIALVRAEEQFGATQDEMAKGVGRTQSYVSKLLKWYQAGCKENSPFIEARKATEKYSHENNSATKVTGNQNEGGDADAFAKLRKVHAARKAEVANDNENDAGADDDDRQNDSKKQRWPATVPEVPEPLKRLLDAASRVATRKAIATYVMNFVDMDKSIPSEKDLSADVNWLIAELEKSRGESAGSIK